MPETTITLKIDESQKKAFQEAAEKAGVSLSAFMRDATQVAADYSDEWVLRVLKLEEACNKVSIGSQIARIVAHYAAMTTAGLGSRERREPMEVLVHSAFPGIQMSGYKLHTLLEGYYSGVSSEDLEKKWVQLGFHDKAMAALADLPGDEPEWGEPGPTFPPSSRPKSVK